MLGHIHVEFNWKIFYINSTLLTLKVRLKRKRTHPGKTSLWARIDYHFSGRNVGYKTFFMYLLSCSRIQSRGTGAVELCHFSVVVLNHVLARN